MAKAQYQEETIMKRLGLLAMASAIALSPTMASAEEKVLTVGVSDALSGGGAVYGVP